MMLSHHKLSHGREGIAAIHILMHVVAGWLIKQSIIV